MATTGALVAALDRYTHMPTPPAACSAAVESDVDSCHAPGSAAPASHTLARTVVGFVPVTWNRTCNRSFAARFTPATVVIASVVSAPPVVRTSDNCTDPSDSTRTFVR